MGAQQPPLGQRSDAVHGRQQRGRVLAAGPRSPLAAPLMGVAELGEPVIPHPGIGDHCRCRGDMISDEGEQ